MDSFQTHVRKPAYTKNATSPRISSVILKHNTSESLMGHAADGENGPCIFVQSVSHALGRRHLALGNVDLEAGGAVLLAAQVAGVAARLGAHASCARPAGRDPWRCCDLSGPSARGSCSCLHPRHHVKSSHQCLRLICANACANSQLDAHHQMFCNSTYSVQQSTRGFIWGCHASCLSCYER